MAATMTKPEYGTAEYARYIDSLEGMCVRCAGGAIPNLDFCVNCANDVEVEIDGVLCWVGDDHPLHPHYVDYAALDRAYELGYVDSRGRADVEAMEAAIASEAGRYPYEEWDELDFPPKRHPKFRTPGIATILFGAGQPTPIMFAVAA